MIYTYINKITYNEIKVEANSPEQAYLKMKIAAQFKIQPYNQQPDNYLEEKNVDGFEQASKNGSR